MLAASLAPSLSMAACSGRTSALCRTYSFEGIVSATSMPNPPWNAATTGSSSPPVKVRLKTFSTARCTSLVRTLSSPPSPNVSISILPLVEATMALRSLTRGATSRSSSRIARLSAFDNKFSQLQMLTRTDTPERWLISGALRARCVSSATTCFMYSAGAY